MSKKRIGIIGATGYTGSELVRILVNHPKVEISVITSESREGECFSDVHPFFRGICDHKLESLERIDKYELDAAFLALPHGVSMDVAKRFKDRTFKIIDLSGDFRLNSPQIYEEWYQKEHVYPEGFEEAVFGLPELYFDEIKKARLVANPGCYPTSAILGLAPLVLEGMIETSPIIVDSKSGVTGAGLKPKAVNLFSNVNDNFRAYGLGRHRHTIEIQGIFDRLAGKDTLVQFTPHLLPVDRGILTTIYASPVKAVSNDELKKIFREFYEEAPFVRLRNEIPAVKDVRGTNYCDIFVLFDERTTMLIIVSVIDNLVKGAAGQAIQNMNIMFGWKQSEGLNMVPVNP